jgi:pimeloyl-ACP methyl ester carboxylesterase
MNRRVVAGLAILPAIALMGATYEHVGRWRDSRRFPPLGQRYDIGGGRTLNLHCEGSGSPIIVFESGKQIPGYFWVSISRQTAAFARSCWYDRAGMGWSDPAPVPHSAVGIAEDLHALLAAAGERPPYVVVAHSLGGFYARVFNGLYRQDVAGLLLIDPASEDIATRMPTTPRRGPPLGLSQPWPVSYTH